ncbi:MAG: AbrB/MazE/SpoVT family DNA-binding domain-containing protein [Candidatus Aenigmarchaeota archaeon]|nr:AbrB/MazE/SpoVT family DNA-binding domain-containing protein [Candidatus Aenigmarchaeota archaeon]
MEFKQKIGSKGEIIIPEELRKMAGLKYDTVIHLSLENHKIYIEPEKENPVIVFKKIAETEPITKKISHEKSYEQEIEERWNKVKR